MNEKSTKEYWNERVRNADNLQDAVYVHQDFEQFDHRTRMMLALFQDKRVLDIGCGWGRLSEQFKGKDYSGVDFSEEMIAKAKELYPDKFFQEWDMAENKMNEKFDVVFECMCLSSFEMTSEQFKEKFKHLADIIVTIEPDQFTIYYL